LWDDPDLNPNADACRELLIIDPDPALIEAHRGGRLCALEALYARIEDLRRQLKAAAWWTWLHDRLLHQVHQNIPLQSPEQWATVLEQMKVDWEVQNMDPDFDILVWFTDRYQEFRRRQQVEKPSH
jgi:hypothetical protein